MRDYILRAPSTGQRGRVIAEYTQTADGREMLGDALWLPDEIKPETAADVLAALRAARQSGREERSAELIPHLDEAADYLRDIVRDEAVSAIQQWGTGWSEPDDSHMPRQHYIVLERSDDPNHTLYLGIRKERHGDIVKRFRVQVLVEEIEQR